MRLVVERQLQQARVIAIGSQVPLTANDAVLGNENATKDQIEKMWTQGLDIAREVHVLAPLDADRTHEHAAQFSQFATTLFGIPLFTVHNEIVL